MILGLYTFPKLPKQMTIIKPEKINATVQTYDDVAYFSWTPSIVGLLLTLKWNAMTLAQFNAIEVLYQADTEVVFDPTSFIGSTTYNVEVANFNGAYFVGNSTYSRINCQLELLIMSVVV